MRTAICITAMLVVVTIWGYFVSAVQNPPANPLLVAAVASDTSLTPAAAPATMTKTRPMKKINVDLAYKVNCSRCHAAPQKFSARMTATVMHHMRVRANLTADESRAVLDYLTE